MKERESSAEDANESRKELPDARRAPDGEAPAASPRRLTLILDRLETSGAGDARGRPKPPLLAEAALTATLAARSADELARNLDDLRDRGLVSDSAQLLRLLVDALPQWPRPDLTARTAPAVSAIERLVALAPDAGEAERRFHELVETGVETFNRGALEKAELVYSAAERLLDRKVIQATRVESVRASGHERLDLGLLRRLLDGQDRREIPRTILRFYREFDPEALLENLRHEPTRQHRRRLLALLEAHRGEGRQAAFERLRRRPEDQHDVFLLRNLVHLLRRIPDDDSSWMPERELGRVVRFLVPENPPFLVRELLAYLSERRHPVAEQALIFFVTTLEEALLSPPGELEDADRQQYGSHLNDTCEALIRYGTPRAWRALADHGLRTEPQLGRPAERLAGLGAQDLSEQPDLVARLVAAARRELPRGALAQPTAQQRSRLQPLLAALAGTHATDVHELLETVAARLSDDEIGRQAAQALSARIAAGGSRLDTPVGASLSGDLAVFGLPTLMQNLGDSRVTGVLGLFDGEGRRAASLEFERGRLTNARYAKRAGPEAVYQLLERPFRGRFTFVPRSRVDEEDGAPRPEVAELLLEGLRRHDELRRATVIVPDDAVFEATSVPARTVPGEDDIDLVASLWEKVVGGTSPLQCEEDLAADAYRIRRCLAHWVEEGALRLSPAPPPPRS